MFEFFNKKILVLIKMAFSYLSFQLTFFITFLYQYWIQKFLIFFILVNFLFF